MCPASLVPYRRSRVGWLVGGGLRAGPAPQHPGRGGHREGAADAAVGKAAWMRGRAEGLQT
eukprot:3134643-Prorocentrum_lima.AAC.1